jgi:protein-export chaperone SecB
MADENDIQATQPADAAQQPAVRFSVQRIYVKDSSFEAPDTPDSFRRPYQPQINFTINNRSKKIEEGIFEVVLRLTADVKQDNKTVFLVEVQQAGVFEVAGLEGERLEQVLSITCPSILFPYGREAIDALVTKGSFPPLMLAPINFEAVYAQAKRNQQAAPAEQVPNPSEAN